MKRKILKIIGITLAAVIALPVLALFAARTVNDVRFRLPGAGGIREKIYIPLGGAEQFVNIRGADAGNPVVIWLHGGAGSPDTFLTTDFQRDLEKEYTFIRWDQRGCGRTYYKSPDAPLSMDQMLRDVDDLVDYAAARFGQPVILAGHSWGSALGITYAAAHPEKITGYVGVGQYIDGNESERLAAETAAQRAREAGNQRDASEIETLYQAYAAVGITEDQFDIKGFMNFRKLTAKYLAPGGGDATLAALLSPDFGWGDLRWELFIITDTKGFFASQRPLYADLQDYAPPEALSVPVAFIQGGNDYVCATALTEAYQKRLLAAPSSELLIIPGTGHSPMLDDPALFGKTLRDALAGLA